MRAAAEDIAPEVDGDHTAGPPPRGERPGIPRGPASAAATAGGAPLEVFAWATADDPGILMRACVDCGRVTGRFCDYCTAASRFPQGDASGRMWAAGQMTPLCSDCDNFRDGCHYCLGLWVTRPVPLYFSPEQLAAQGGMTGGSGARPPGAAGRDADGGGPAARHRGNAPRDSGGAAGPSGGGHP